MPLNDLDHIAHNTGGAGEFAEKTAGAKVIGSVNRSTVFAEESAAGPMLSEDTGILQIVAQRYILTVPGNASLPVLDAYMAWRRIVHTPRIPAQNIVEGDVF